MIVKKICSDDFEKLSKDGKALVRRALSIKGRYLKEYARIQGYAKIKDEAKIKGDDYVAEHAIVLGQAIVYGSAYITSDGYISETEHYVSFNGLGRRLTIFKQTYGKQDGVICGCFVGDLETFKKQIFGDGNYTKYDDLPLHRKEYLKIVEIWEMRQKEKELV